MTYQKYTKVMVKDSKGNMVNGMVLQPADFDDTEMWWVEFQDRGYREVTIFSKVDLDKWNDAGPIAACVCGASKIGHPGHSTWCDVK